MQIKYVNNNGGGFAERTILADGTTLKQFVVLKVQDETPGEFKIRVNGQVETGDYILKDGDRVSVTPDKLGGAC